MRLHALTTYIPPEKLGAEEIILAAGGSKNEARAFTRMFGINQVAALPAQADILQKYLEMADELESQCDSQKPDTLIHVHGQPIFPYGSETLLELLPRLHSFFSDLKRVYELDQYNCAGLFWALDMARGLLSSDIGAQVIAIFGGDSHIGLPMAKRYVPGCSLLGDAFCAMVVDQKSGGCQLDQLNLQIYPEFYPGRSASQTEMGAFFRYHNTMVLTALEQIGFRPDHTEAIFPHNVNRLSWIQFCNAHGFPLSKVALGLLPDVGHCFTTDPFLLLSNLFNDPKPDLTSVLLLSVGMGGFVGSCRARFEISPVLATPNTRSQTCNFTSNRTSL